MSTATIAVSAGAVKFKGKWYTPEDVREAIPKCRERFPTTMQGSAYTTSVDGRPFAPKKLVHCMTERSFNHLDSEECRDFLAALGFSSHPIPGSGY